MLMIEGLCLVGLRSLRSHSRKRCEHVCGYVHVSVCVCMWCVCGVCVIYVMCVYVLCVCVCGVWYVCGMCVYVWCVYVCGMCVHVCCMCMCDVCWCIGVCGVYVWCMYMWCVCGVWYVWCMCMCVYVCVCELCVCMYGVCVCVCVCVCVLEFYLECLLQLLFNLFFMVESLTQKPMNSARLSPGAPEISCLSFPRTEIKDTFYHAQLLPMGVGDPNSSFHGYVTNTLPTKPSSLTLIHYFHVSVYLCLCLPVSTCACVCMYEHIKCSCEHLRIVYVLVQVCSYYCFFLPFFSSFLPSFLSLSFLETKSHVVQAGPCS